MYGQQSDHLKAINTGHAINSSNTRNASVYGVGCAPGSPAMGPASSPATDRGTESRTCRNQGPRVFQVGRNQLSRRRAAASHRTGSAAAIVIELSGRPCNRRRLRPPLPRRDRPCRNEGPRAFSSARVPLLPAGSSSSAQPASPRSCCRLSRSSPAQQLDSCCRGRRPLVRCRWLLVRARQAGAPLLPALRQSRRDQLAVSRCCCQHAAGSRHLVRERRQPRPGPGQRRAAVGDSTSRRLDGLGRLAALDVSKKKKMPVIRERGQALGVRRPRGQSPVRGCRPRTPAPRRRGRQSLADEHASRRRSPTLIASAQPALVSAPRPPPPAAPLRTFRPSPDQPQLRPASSPAGSASA